MKKIPGTDQKLIEIIEDILAKTPESLSDYEIQFLRARRSYLTKAEQQEFESVLEIQPKRTKKTSPIKNKVHRRKRRKNKNKLARKEAKND